MEYPSYGVYKKENPTEKVIFEDTLAVYDWAVSSLKFKSNNIFSFGRSIGSGPATYLASKKEIGMLILFSPYTCLRDVAKEHASVFGYFVKNRFKNIKHIKEVDCPIFIVHGKRDKVINVSNSSKLIEAIKHDKKVLISPLYMTHNEFSVEVDFYTPLVNFILDNIDSLENMKNLKKKQKKKDMNLGNPELDILDQFKTN